jgi:hypothetical protein
MVAADPRSRDGATRPGHRGSRPARRGTSNRVELGRLDFLARSTRDHKRPEGSTGLVYGRRAHGQADGRRHLAPGPTGDPPRHPHVAGPGLSGNGSPGHVRDMSRRIGPAPLGCATRHCPRPPGISTDFPQSLFAARLMNHTKRELENIVTLSSVRTRWTAQ